MSLFDLFLVIVTILAVIGWCYLLYERLGANWTYANKWSRCPHCVRPIKRGDRILDGPDGWAHLGCQNGR